MLYQLSYSRWWAGKDSNLRRLSQQIYSLPPLATWVPAPKQKFSPCFTQMSDYGAVEISKMLQRAGEGTRTPDLLITNQLLYRLSYASKTSHPVAIPITIHAPIHYSLRLYAINSRRSFFSLSTCPTKGFIELPDQKQCNQGSHESAVA